MTSEVTDWLPAETGFDADAFRTVWSKIVDYQLAAAESLRAEDAAKRTG